MVFVEYGGFARALLVSLGLDRGTELGYWWGLVRDVVRNGRSWGMRNLLVESARWG